MNVEPMFIGSAIFQESISPANPTELGVLLYRQHILMAHLSSRMQNEPNLIPKRERQVRRAITSHPSRGPYHAGRPNFPGPV